MSEPVNNFNQFNETESNLCPFFNKNKFNTDNEKYMVWRVEVRLMNVTKFSPWLTQFKIHF